MVETAHTGHSSCHYGPDVFSTQIERCVRSSCCHLLLGRPKTSVKFSRNPTRSSQRDTSLDWDSDSPQWLHHHRYDLAYEWIDSRSVIKQWEGWCSEKGKDSLPVILRFQRKENHTVGCFQFLLAYCEQQPKFSMDCWSSLAAMFKECLSQPISSTVTFLMIRFGEDFFANDLSLFLHVCRIWSFYIKQAISFIEKRDLNDVQVRIHPTFVFLITKSVFHCRISLWRC